MKILSLFSGIGAFEEGLNKNGITYELVNYCEFDEYPSKAYSIIHNVPEDKNLGDITKVDEKTLEYFDYMTYGFPCQSFSMQGKRLGFDDPTKGDLFFHSMRIAKYKQPKFMIGENVVGLVTHDKGNTFKTVLATLDYIGYNTYYKIMNSYDFGSAQSRERVFLVSIRKDIDKGFEFPAPYEYKVSVKDILENHPRKTMKESLIKYNDPKYFVNNYKSDKGMIKLFDGCSEGYFQSSFCSNRIYSIEGSSPTMTTKNDCVFSEINGHLTSRERFILQGFNPNYVDQLKNSGLSQGRIDKMSGNSINVNVIGEIQKKLFNDYKDLI